MRRWVALALVVVMGAPAYGQAPMSPLVQSVAGIISFTRWPIPPASVALCVVSAREGGAPAGTEAFFAAPMQAGNLPVRPRHVTPADPLDGCNALYLGRLSMADRRQILRRIEGLAVLTMGEAGPDCTDLTMFCLTVDLDAMRGGAVTFTTNIDMISRGGVRLNPRVLLLGRKADGTADGKVRGVPQ